MAIILSQNYPMKLTWCGLDSLKKLLKQPCVLCGKYSTQAICLECDSQLSVNNKRCYGCGISLEKEVALDYCGKCLNSSLSFDRVFVVYDYCIGIRKLIHLFKYKQNLAIGRFFASKLFTNLQDLNCKYDAIIPMPLHKKRLQRRGFNQVVELLFFINKKSLVDSLSCIRIKKTQELNLLNSQERQKEMKEAFKVVKNINYKSILIVDDVMTTTASANELAKEILKSYGKDKPKIDILVLARTM